MGEAGLSKQAARSPAPGFWSQEPRGFTSTEGLSFCPLRPGVLTATMTHGVQPPGPDLSSPRGVCGAQVTITSQTLRSQPLLAGSKAPPQSPHHTSPRPGMLFPLSDRHAPLPVRVLSQACPGLLGGLALPPVALLNLTLTLGDLGAPPSHDLSAGATLDLTVRGLPQAMLPCEPENPK